MKFTVNYWRITRSLDEQVCFHLLDEFGVPITISGASEVWMRVKNQDNSILSKPALNGISVGISSPLWIYSFALTAAETEALPLGKLTVDIKVLFGALVREFSFSNALEIVDLPF